MAPIVAGSGGRVAAAIGTMQSVSTRAKDSRMRGGTKVSPMPGSSMTMAPTRRKTRPAAQISAGRA
jgi:hypothetical protein